MKITLVKIIWMILLGGLAAVSLSAISQKKGEPITGVDVRVEQFSGGEFFLSEEDVHDELAAILGPDLSQYYIGDINTREIEDALMYNPFIRTANVYVSSDGILGISVVQREPLLRVMEAQGDSYYLDYDGKIIPVSPYFTARVMIITGHLQVQQDYEKKKGDELPDNERLMYLVNVLDADPFLRSLTEQINISEQREVVIVPKAGDFEILFGTLDAVDMKLKKLKAIYTQIVRAEGWDKYEQFDLSLDGQVRGKVKPSYHK